MTRRGFHALLALTLVICLLCPFAEEFALHWDQTIFDTGYDGESTVAVIALLLILAFAIARLLVDFVLKDTSGEPLVDSEPVLGLAFDFISIPYDSCPPLPLRI